MIIDHQIIAFAGIAALLTITPGQDTVLVIRNVMAQGQRAGLLTTFGICCGLFVHATLSAAGLSLILLKSATAFEVVKLLGAAYLIWPFSGHRLTAALCLTLSGFYVCAFIADHCF
jgi:threonine/homoserine/homoserine lactone efflux protein